MQFKSTVYVVYNTFNAFGEPTETTRLPIKCAIIKRNKHVKQTIEQRYRDYAMKIITSHKSFAPYCDLLKDDGLLFEYDGTMYKPQIVSEINDSSGRTKYVEIQLNEEVL